MDPLSFRLALAIEVDRALSREVVLLSILAEHGDFHSARPVTMPLGPAACLRCSARVMSLSSSFQGTS